jgi:hypothetical protein
VNTSDEFPEKNISSTEKISNEVQGFVSNAKLLGSITTTLGLAGTVAGSIAAITAGPIVLAGIALVGGAAALFAKEYSLNRKKTLESEINDLRNSKKITPDTASALQNELDSIYADRPSEKVEEIDSHDDK